MDIEHQKSFGFAATLMLVREARIGRMSLGLLSMQAGYYATDNKVTALQNTDDAREFFTKEVEELPGVPEIPNQRIIDIFVDAFETVTDPEKYREFMQTVEKENCL